MGNGDFIGQNGVFAGNDAVVCLVKKDGRLGLMPLRRGGQHRFGTVRPVGDIEQFEADMRIEIGFILWI